MELKGVKGYFFLTKRCNFVPEMANDYFQFRQFTVHQGRCAMKVGTDGTLLGAWARGCPIVVNAIKRCDDSLLVAQARGGSSALCSVSGGFFDGSCSVLDIGTGTGLIALMIAQRFPEAHVIGVDIDPDAVKQARDNVAASPFRNLEIVEADVKYFNPHSYFNAIVSNPPYFVDSLESPDAHRTLARHTATLSYHDLMDATWRLLADDGELSVIIPFDCKLQLEKEAMLRGFFKSRECAVRTTPRKQPRRYLMAFRKHPSELEITEGVIETAPNVRSAWYQELTKEFYL